MPKATLLAMGVNPNLTNGKLPAGQHFIDASVSAANVPTLQQYADALAASPPAPVENPAAGAGTQIPRTPAPSAPTTSTQRQTVPVVSTLTASQQAASTARILAQGASYNATAIPAN